MFICLFNLKYELVAAIRAMSFPESRIVALGTKLKSAILVTQIRACVVHARHKNGERVITFRKDYNANGS